MILYCLLRLLLEEIFRCACVIYHPLLFNSHIGCCTLVIASISGLLTGHGTFSFDKSPISPFEKIGEFPRTVYLQRWMLSSLARQYYAPKKLVVRGDQDIPCEVCGGMRNATVAVLGGDAVQSKNETQTRLNGMAQVVTHCCDACCRAALGTSTPSDNEPRHWTIMPLVHSIERPLH